MQTRLKAVSRNHICRRCGADSWYPNGVLPVSGDPKWACAPCKKNNVKAWQARNPERHKEQQRRGLRKFNMAKYGLTVDQYDTMFRAQDGLCAICRQPEIGRRLHVDHHHTSGRIRGLLCGPCNRALGLLRDDAAIARAAANYLEGG